MAYKDPEDVKMSLGDHLDDLRYRLLLGLIGPVAIMIAALYFSPGIIKWLQRPLHVALQQNGLPPETINTNILGGFSIYLNVSFMTGLILGIPWLFYQLWMFIAPGLYPKKRKLVYRIIPGSLVLAIVGVLFMYYVILPITLHFLIQFSMGIPIADLTPNIIERSLIDSSGIATTDPGLALPQFPVLADDPKVHGLGQAWLKVPENELRFDMDGKGKILHLKLTEHMAMKPLPDAQTYYSLVLMMAAGFAIAFQLPMVMLVVGWVGMFDAQQFRGARRYAVLTCVILGAVLTPTGDPITLSLLAVPLYLLYELGILLIVWFAAKPKEPKEA